MKLGIENEDEFAFGTVDYTDNKSDIPDENGFCIYYYVCDVVTRNETKKPEAMFNVGGLLSSWIMFIFR